MVRQGLLLTVFLGQALPSVLGAWSMVLWLLNILATARAKTSVTRISTQLLLLTLRNKNVSEQ